MDWLNNWFKGAFEKFGELQLWAVIVVAILAVGSVAALIIIAAKKKKNADAAPIKKGWDTRMILIGALCIALAFVLSYIRIVHMPQGGSITLASMLPIMLFAYIYGTPRGLIVGLAYGALQMLQDPYIVHWAQAIVDYGFAFMALALPGLFKKSILPGIILGGFVRYACHVVSGIIFFASYAPAQDFNSVLIYSLGYNSVVMIEVAIIVVLVAAVPQLRKFMNAQRALTHP
jgi:thiamine transporter